MLGQDNAGIMLFERRGQKMFDENKESGRRKVRQQIPNHRDYSDFYGGILEKIWKSALVFNADKGGNFVRIRDEAFNI
ncbi:hypothetical protein WN51_02165 [Melipona quadrifasciata]|uniref:Uncharacterized protein n=1 Tax=Melipona quadrifasciata TaxID=166423 RepID=A0A0N0BDX3_9HYME|nr:hypothetical protein WN51_02165 [Melipona quadrifasciata]